MNGARVANVNVHVSYARRQYHNDRGDTPMWSRSGTCSFYFCCDLYYALTLKYLRISRFVFEKPETR